MSAYGMKPSFTDYNGYRKWLQEWKAIYVHLSQICRKRKIEIKNACRQQDWTLVKKLKEKYQYDKSMATKMLTLRNEAVIRRLNIRTMQANLRKQHELFPLLIEDARNIDFHFNKKHLEFPQIPMWTLKAKGITYSINHLDCQIHWSTKERLDDSSTKGCIRIKRGNITIDAKGHATITT